MQILLVEDDAGLSEAVVSGLGSHGISVTHADGLMSGRRAWALGEFDVIILDVVLPDGSGFDLCRRRRSEGDDTPVLMLTARDTVEDRVRGLDEGADDYLIKPFAFDELVARVRALARRQPGLLPERVEVGDLVADLRSRSLARAGHPVQLTNREWDLFEFFVRHRDAVVDRASITAYVWDDNHDPFSNALEVLIRRLRAKIDDAFESKLIQTVRGAGYRFGVPDPADDEAVDRG